MEDHLKKYSRLVLIQALDYQQNLSYFRVKNAITYMFLDDAWQSFDDAVQENFAVHNYQHLID
jgi:hypothetical protein